MGVKNVWKCAYVIYEWSPRFQYQAPWLEGPDLAFELMYNGQGQILRKRMASKGHEHVTYTYDGNDMLKKIMVGETESELGNLIYFVH